MNPDTEKRVIGSKLAQEDKGFVGVKDGISGLIRMYMKREIDKYSFQYTTTDMTGRRNWLPIEDFKAIRQGSAGSLISLENKTLPSDVLNTIATWEVNNVFTGIKGGNDSLNEMSKEQINNKQLAISRKRNTKQWIPGDQFVDILKSKGY